MGYYRDEWKPQVAPKRPSKRGFKNKKEADMVEKKPLFSRGYAKVRAKIRKGSRYTMSCYNCKYYYQACGDDEEVCQNRAVLKYDMTITDSSIFCNLWEISDRKSESTSAESIFKKGVKL